MMPSKAFVPVRAITSGPSAHWFTDYDKLAFDVNHQLFNPDGSRFVLLHRWRKAGNGRYADVGGFGTRMITAAGDAIHLRVIDDSGYTSHFIRRDSHRILAWTRLPESGDGFYLFAESSERNNASLIGRETIKCNGHCTSLPGGKGI